MSKSPARGAKSPRKLPSDVQSVTHKRVASRTKMASKVGDKKKKGAIKKTAHNEKLGLLTAPVATLYYFAISLMDFIAWLG